MMFLLRKFAADGGVKKETHPVRPSRSAQWGHQIASLVSAVGSPPVLGASTVIFVASALSDSQGAIWVWIWALVCAVLTVLVPLGYILWLLRHGWVADFDIRRRKERTKPMIVNVASSGLAWAVLKVGAAPAELVALAAALWIQAALLLIITLRWKISVHTAAAAGMGAVIWTLTGTALPLIIGVPVVAWSRIRLDHHTFAQTVAGAVLGFTVFHWALRFLV